MCGRPSWHSWVLHACERCSDSGVMAYGWQQVMCGSVVHQAGVAGEGGVWVIQTCFAIVGYYFNSCLMRLGQLADVADWWADACVGVADVAGRLVGY